MLSTYLIVHAVTDWQGGRDHGTWLPLVGLAINPSHDFQPHNFPSLSKPLFSQKLFSIYSHITQTASKLVFLSFLLSQSHWHERKVDCSLITNVIMWSTHFTCLINTTAAITCSLLTFIPSHVSMHIIIRSGTCLYFITLLSIT